jgi:NAD(P)H-nitrite reductase large subunit
MKNIDKIQLRCKTMISKSVGYEQEVTLTDVDASDFLYEIKDFLTTDRLDAMAGVLLQVYSIKQIIEALTKASLKNKKAV